MEKHKYASLINRSKTYANIKLEFLLKKSEFIYFKKNDRNEYLLRNLETEVELFVKGELGSWLSDFEILPDSKVAEFIGYSIESYEFEQCNCDPYELIEKWLKCYFYIINLKKHLNDKPEGYKYKDIFRNEDHAKRVIEILTEIGWIDKNVIFKGETGTPNEFGQLFTLAEELKLFIDKPREKKFRIVAFGKGLGLKIKEQHDERIFSTIRGVLNKKIVNSTINSRIRGKFEELSRELSNIENSK